MRSSSVKPIGCCHTSPRTAFGHTPTWLKVLPAPPRKASTNYRRKNFAETQSAPAKSVVANGDPPKGGQPITCRLRIILDSHRQASGTCGQAECESAGLVPFSGGGVTDGAATIGPGLVGATSPGAGAIAGVAGAALTLLPAFGGVDVLRFGSW